MIHFTNNVFDANLLTSKELEEIISYFIATTTKLPLNILDNDRIDEVTLKKLSDFGILSDVNNISEIQQLIGDELFYMLIKIMNSISMSDLEKFEELKKYHLLSREKIVRNEKLSNKPTIADLFCGSGGLSLGLVQSGFRVVFANDIEKSALRTYNFNHPEIDGKNITLGGIENISHNINNYIDESIDVLVGGPPCQGFSMANRQRIIDDPRNILYKYYVESVKLLHPKFFIMENVKGMQKVADQVVEDFNNSTSTKYDIAYRVLNAKEMGIPQNRERLIYIGVREDVSLKNKVKAIEIFNSIKLDYSINKYVPLKDAILDLKKVEASRVKNSTKGDKKSGFIIENNESVSVSEYVNKINLFREHKLIYNHKARFNNDRDIEIFGRMLPGDKSDSPRIADIMPYKSRNHVFKDKYNKLLPDQPCKTITAHMKFDCNMYIHPFQARGLTPREAARVQSYPDDYLFLGAYTKTFQQIGNSVPPLMAKKIGEAIIGYI